MKKLTSAGARIPLLITLGCTLAAPVPAQVLEEVVVVARKRAENLQDTPVAVSAFSTEDMREAQINNLSDLPRTVPGLTNTDGAKFSGLTIRGVGSRVNKSSVDPGVGVYVDGLFLPRNDTQLVDVVDMESIQVLRGPQGTLFGKNTAGGAILMSSLKPTEEFSGSVEAKAGDFDRRDFKARFSGPLLENTLFGAITYNSRQADGYMDDYYTGRDFGDVDREAVAGQLRYTPGDNLVADLIVLWGERREAAAPRTCRLLNPQGALQSFTAPASETPFSDLCTLSEELADDEKVINDPEESHFDVTNNLAGLTLEWQWGDIELKSITGYLHQEDLQRDSDQDATPLLSIAKFSEVSRQFEGNGMEGYGEERDFISQEFNLFGSFLDDRVDYTLGVYASDEKIDDNIDGNALSLGTWTGIPQPNDSVLTLLPQGVGLRNPQVNDFTSQSAAAFGQLIYSFNDLWQFTLGGRYTWEEKTVEQNNWVPTTLPLGTIPRDEFNALIDDIQPLAIHPDTPKLKEKKDWTEFSPSATVTLFAPDNWKGELIDEAMFYLTYSEGFKAGGFSGFGLVMTDFDPEIVDNYEFGFKVDMWDSRVRLNGALYTMDYDDMQLSVTRTFGDLNSEFGITNAGDAEVSGAELELSVMPVEGLLLGVTGSYIDADYNEFVDEFTDEDDNTVTFDRSNEPFANVPEQTYSWFAQYHWDTAFATIIPRVSGYYKDETYIGSEPFAFNYVDNGTTLDDFTVWNARVSVLPNRWEGLEVAVYANNVTDEDYYGTGQAQADIVGVASLVRGKPDHYGVEVYYTW